MSLAPYVRILGRGPGRARHLSRDEARAAMGLILSGEAAPEAVGALLMLMRYRGETAAEIAGFTEAMRDALPGMPPADLDWPSYAAGRTRGLPLFLLAAKLVARAGHRVLIHGWNSHQVDGGSVRAALRPLDIPVARPGPVAYVPLETILPAAHHLLGLRDVLGLRSPVNTALRALNPAGARASVQGVFHPPFRALQADAARLLGQSALTVFKGGGEFERHPGKASDLTGLRKGAAREGRSPVLLGVTRRLAGEDRPSPKALPALWAGDLADLLAEAVVTGTAALALFTLEDLPLDVADARAGALWSARHRARAA